MKRQVFAIAFAVMLTVVSHASERHALMSLYWCLSGEDWKKSDGWLSDTPLEEWHGIAVRNGQVIAINLAGNGLRGELPYFLSELKHLENLNLRWNSIGGEIPETIGHLEALETLLLTGNQFTGNIPWNLGRLLNLKRLDLSYNQLTGEVPATFGDARSLESLGLQHNNLIGPLAVELAQIDSLRRLIVSRNNLGTQTLRDILGRTVPHPMVIEDSLHGSSSQFPEITGLDMLEQTTMVFDDHRILEFVAQVMAAVFVQNGELRLDPTKLPQTISHEDVVKAIENTNKCLRRSGESIESVNEFERTLELCGDATITIPEEPAPVRTVQAF